MRPVYRAVEKVDDLGLHAIRIDLDPAKELAPLGARGRADVLEAEVGDLFLGVRTCLVDRDERHADAREDRRCRLLLGLREREERAEL